MKAADSTDARHRRLPGGRPVDPFAGSWESRYGEVGDGWGRAAAYDAYADGLHTYAIWALRDHDAAVDALYCAFVIADRNVAHLRQPEQIQPWLYAILRHECAARASGGEAPAAASTRLRPSGGCADSDGALVALDRKLRQAEFQSLEWPEAEGLAPAHREVLELAIRHGLDSHSLGLVLGLDRRADPAGGQGGAVGFDLLADAWRELERSLAAVAVARGPREHCARLAELAFGWSGRLNAALREPLTEHVHGCSRCQHYLHTVVGTPSAPTILPFVAAPRALRDLVLGELNDPAAALCAGVDHAALARRVRHFCPEGFPVAAPPAPAGWRGKRRAALKNPAHDRAGQPQAAFGTARTLRAAHDRGQGAPDPVAEGVYREPGSWADRVLPPTGSDPVSASQYPKFPGTGAPPRGATDAAELKPAPRHRARPVREAMTSALALGVAGVAATASASMLGWTSGGHPGHLAGGPSAPEPGSAPGAGRVSLPGAGPRVLHVAAPRALSASEPAGAAGGAAPAASSTAAAGDFHVSVNQRSADPDSVAILLRNSGNTPIAWSAAAKDGWITLSQSSGTLAAGGQQVIVASTTAAAPKGVWATTVAFAPGGAVIGLHGTSVPGGSPSARPTGPTGSPASGSPTPTPSPTPTSTPSASPGPTGSAAPPGSASPGPAKTPSTAATPQRALSSRAPVTAR